MPHMTKKSAETFWNSYYRKNIAQDKSSLRQSWNDYTDALCKEGAITVKQYERWVQPRCCA